MNLSELLAGSTSGLDPVVGTLFVLAVAVVLAVVFEMVVVRLVRRAVARSELWIDDIVFEELRWPLVASASLGAVYYLTRVVATPTVLAGPQLDTFFGRPVLSVLVVVWAWGLNRTVNRGVSTASERGLDVDFAPVFSNVFTIAVAVATGASLFTIWGIEITPLLGAAGIAGIAIGFAAKDTVANFFGGTALYFDRTYKIGDYVELEDGTAGTVVRVGIRSTTLLTRDEVMVTVPNALLNATRISNQSAPQRRKRVRVPFGVAYGTDLDETESTVLAVTETVSSVLEVPRPRLRLRNLGDSALEYELLCWVRSPNREGSTIHHLNREIYRALTDSGIEIPFPQRAVTLTHAGGSNGYASVEDRIAAPTGQSTTDDQRDGETTTGERPDETNAESA